VREGKPSFTAEAVAAARAMTGVDAVATDLVDGPLSWVIRAGRLGFGAPLAINVASLGLLDHIEMRTRAIDTAVREGVTAGATQLVLLGAGLDARAWRMPELSGVRVFEVDFPSTQATKRARIGARMPTAKQVTFVAVDFARDSLEERLGRAGHDADATTFWIWEGVTPYLPLDATRSTLSAIGARSAVGSRLAVTYATPAAARLGPGLLRVGLLGFRVMGEAIVGLISTSDMHAALGEVGFRVLDDASARDWAARHGRGRPRLMLVEERLAVAVIDGRPRASRAA
jgi:methyltransferase (TIGR00027 family)